MTFGLRASRKENEHEVEGVQGRRKCRGSGSRFFCAVRVCPPRQKSADAFLLEAVTLNCRFARTDGHVHGRTRGRLLRQQKTSRDPGNLPILRERTDLASRIYPRNLDSMTVRILGF